MGHVARSTGGDEVPLFVVARVSVQGLVGAVIEETGPYVVCDWDGVIDPKAGFEDPEATSEVAALDTYAEESVSGTGYHAICKAKKPGECCTNKRRGFEMYEKVRFLVFTGRHVPGTPTTINERSSELTELYRKIFGDPSEESTLAARSLPAISDATVIDRTKRKRGQPYVQLMAGERSDNTDNSEPEFRLARWFADFTDDPDQIERLMRQSRLKDTRTEKLHKWDEGHRYLPDTARKAIASARKYQAQQALPPVSGPVGGSYDA
jgi:putative DNA primase/helicase